MKDAKRNRPMVEQPTGTVTFLFTDVEGITQLWERFPRAMQAALARHDTLLQKEITSHEGYVVKARGDGFHAAFARAPDAIAAALGAQRALQAENWGDAVIQVRMALHSGAGEERAGDYFGTATNRAARLLSAGHGGQILLSLATRELVRDQLPVQVELRDLGNHRLKDLSRPERIFQVVAPDLPAGFAPLKTLDYHPNNLPAQTTSFVGREAELAAVTKELLRPEVRLLTLTAPGGTGKTRLGLQVAADLLDHFEDGVFVVALAAINNPALVISTIAHILAIPTGEQVGEERPIVELLTDYLRNKLLLLILDNFEHVGPAAPLVSELLAAAPQVKVLVTSRASLQIYGERIYSVPPLIAPDPQEFLPLEQLTEYAAVQLFVERAQAVHADFDLSDENARAVVDICHRLVGSPLAIELAAAWVKLLTPAEIAAEIDQSLDFLATELHDVPTAHRSVRAVFDHSWRLLKERERDVFQGLSVFRGGFTREAAQQVTGASLHELMALGHKSLLQRTATGRYEVHELLRQYAEERLDRSPTEHEAAHDRHCAYFCAAQQSWAADLCGARQEIALAEMDAEIENARAAWSWAVERRHVEHLDQALVGLGRFYTWRGRHQEGEAACRLAADGLGAAENDAERLLLAQVLSIQAFFNWKLGRTALARQQSETSLALLERLEASDAKARLATAYALLEVGHVASDSDPDEARGFYEQSLALFRELDHRYGMALTLYALGELTRHLGVYDEATRWHEEALALRKALSDQRDVAASLGGLSAIAVYQGRFEEGHRLIRQRTAIHREIGNRAGIADGLRDLGVTLNYLGEFAEAYHPLEESIALYHDLGVRNGLAIARAGLAFSEFMQGRYEQARAHAKTGLGLAEDTGHPLGMAGGLAILGSVALTAGGFAEARNLFQRAVDILRELGQRDELGWVLTGLGSAELGLGNVAATRQHYREAVQTAVEIRSFMTFLLALPGLILLLMVEGQQERALELNGLMMRYPLMANAQFTEDFVGRNLAAVAASLPPDVAAAAQERGATRDLWATAEELLAQLGA